MNQLLDMGTSITSRAFRPSTKENNTSYSRVSEYHNSVNQDGIEAELHCHVSSNQKNIFNTSVMA